MRPTLWADLKINFDNRYFTEEQFLMLLGYLNVHLKSLSLFKWLGMTGDFFRAIIDLVPNLNSLMTCWLEPQFTTGAVKEITDKLVNLKALDLRTLLLEDKHLKSLEKLTRVNCVQISGNYLSNDACMSLFRVNSNLKVVKISASELLSSE